MRSKRPNGGPRWAADAESARPGEDLEGVDRDFGQRLWAETLDRDFGQRLWTDLMPESSTLVPGGAADPPPRSARRREWVIKHACPNMLALALVLVLARALALVLVLALWCLVFF